MTGLQEDRRSYSTLEWLGSDGTAGVPQALGPAVTVGFDNTPELDGTASAPEVRLGTSPQVFYSTLPPEAINTVEISQDLVPGNAKARKWAKRVLAILGLMVVAALATGLKIGLQKKNKTPPNTVNSSLTQQIIDDSSLAATLATNGDRHLFFQNPQGTIRRMIYTENQWIADLDSIAISDAKMLTPIAVSALTALSRVNSSTSSEHVVSSNQLALYYITTSNYLSSSLFNGSKWYPGQDPSFNYTAAPDTRQLSIASNSSQSGQTSGTVNQNLLLYEDSGGNVAALLQVQQLCPVNDCGNDHGQYWVDVTSINHSIPSSDFSPVNYNSSYNPLDHMPLRNGVIVSSTLYESRPGAKFSPPFATGASLFERKAGLSVDLLMCDGGNQTSDFSPGSPSSWCNNVAYTTYRSWTNASHGFFEAQQDTEPNYGDDSHFGQYPSSFLNIEKSDLAIIDYGSGVFAFWINGTTPSLLGYNNIISSNIGPNVSFPFKRLASINIPEQNTSYLYHQIDGTTLAEEHYDYSLSRWLSTNVTIPNA